jgi:hypothetical protein
MALETKAEVAAVLRRTGRLLRVLVMGGAALAAACASVPKGGDGTASSADSKGQGSKPADPGSQRGTGVPGW